MHILSRRLLFIFFFCWLTASCHCFSSFKHFFVFFHYYYIYCFQWNETLSNKWRTTRRMYRNVMNKYFSCFRMYRNHFPWPADTQTRWISNKKNKFSLKFFFFSLTANFFTHIFFSRHFSAQLVHMEAVIIIYRICANSFPSLKKQ